MAQPGIASATTASQAIALLNQQRAANGIPATIVEDPNLSEGCREYDHYRALNPQDPPHHEIPGHAGYTALGAGEGLAYSEVNASIDNWTATTNAWDGAPIHQSLMFNPLATAAGYAFAEGTACMRFTGSGGVGAPTFYAFVDDHGPGAVAYSETVAESPYVPQQLVGLSPNATTGPNILAFAEGLGGPHVTSVGLAVAGGASVPDVRFVDADTPGAGGFFGNAVDVIPANPLRPGTAYVATINWQAGVGQPYSLPQTQVIAFTTALHSNRVHVSVSVGRLGQRISVSSEASHPALTLNGPARLMPALASDGTVSLKLAPGHWTACAMSGGLGSGYVVGQECTSFTVVGQPGLALGSIVRRRSGRYAVLTVAVAAVGRRATIARRYSGVACKPHVVCTHSLVTASKIVLHARQKVLVPRLARGEKLQLTVTTAAFTLAGAPYAAGRASRTYR
jgi:hypothetical protein